ncbi:carboxylesterase family protein [Janthinobacterium sp. 17J80-10]|uniref:carboxylesterase/lipase family protein n=1 Tax=Janthinobacterium sp. 17J80-10 TaxID=2497863 RepID=UPI0010059F86|nr:carboxylesterase family protein [Janthinobacterium sp. 17J80-10]QAU32699.1 carboxylesterase/lipase family protein [Janthinobacterium sp. 17J80-10]
MKLVGKWRCMLAVAGAVTTLLGGCGGGTGIATSTAQDLPLLRSTQYGQIEGADDAASGTYSWKGIPFARPPVGNLRWKAPVEPDNWPAVLAAKSFGNACVQYGRLYGPGSNNTYDASIGTTLNQAVGSEDCLTLNIWRPASTDTNLPVIYFIYGGSNVSGYTADPVYDGAALAKAANAVVVTANYRVGLFGWLSLPQLKSGTNAQEDSGNFGTLDQIQTLKFINKNIANFGGNPGNVTVMGQSAGAINVYSLLTSPLVVSNATQLFHRAVPLSGGISTASELPVGSIALVNSSATALAQGNKLLYSLLIADGKASDDATAAAYAATQTSAQIADYMRAKTPAQIFTQLLTKLAAAGLSSTSHIPDGAVVANTPIAAINAGNYLKVPVLASNTAEETKLFASFLALSPALGGQPGLIVNDATRFGMMYNFKPDAAATLTVNDLINPAYLPVDTPTTGYNARLALLNNLFFVPNRDSALNALKSRQANVWYYQFNWNKEPAPWNDVYGAAHAFDLPFLFGNFGPSLFSNVTNSTANKGGRLELSGAMMSTIAAFAKNGDPNNAALGVTWPAWPKKLIFDATLATKNISVQ